MAGPETGWGVSRADDEATTARCRTGALTRAGDRTRDRVERGASTPLVAAACAVVVLLGVFASLAVGSAVSAAKARAAADLAAVAGAGALLSGLLEGSSADPCRVASSVAARNGATMTQCILDGGVNVTVEVAVHPAHAVDPLGLGPAVAKARAGPDPARSVPGPGPGVVADDRRDPPSRR